MNGIRPGRWLLSLVGLFTAIAPWVADFGLTHMYNDRWPPHAKFHNGQTLLLGTLLGLLTLFYTWRRRGFAPDNLGVAAILASLYWITQATAGLLPNTALTDPEFLGSTRFPFGLTGPQPFLDVVVLTIVAVAYALERSWMTRNARP
jgi:hypothetical protein